MTASEIAAWAGLIGVIVTLGWRIVEWFHRDLDEKTKGEIRRAVDEKVERTKGDVRREVEQDLKEHESRLRLEQEMRLRLHEKSWQLIRDLLDAALLADRLLREWLLYIAWAAVAADDDAPKIKQAHDAHRDKIYEVLSRLQTLAATAPPDRSATQAIRPLLGGYSLAVNCVYNPTPSQVIAAAVDEALRLSAQGVGQVGALVEKWNAGLWQQNATTEEERDRYRIAADLQAKLVEQKPTVPAAPEPEQPEPKRKAGH